MPEKKDPSRFPEVKEAYKKRERLPCFTKFFGESVSEPLGVVRPAESANRCQDCPDSDICFRLCLLKRLDIAGENQKLLIAMLEGRLS